MQTVKDTIETLIEESYLLTLSEERLDEELDQFIHTCKTIIRENVRDIVRRRRLLRRITSIHATMLKSDKDSQHIHRILFGKRGRKHLKWEEKVKRVTGIKRAIIRGIEEDEPQLVYFIEHDILQPHMSPPLLEARENRKQWPRIKGWVPMCIGLVVFGLLMLLLYLVVRG